MSGSETNQLIFGPVPSRRLGFSVGINNIPPKVCSYACVYCQLGKARRMQYRREAFYRPDELFDQCQRHLEQLEDKVDYLTLVSDGEPTLDQNLGKLIRLLKTTHIPVAVISNSSLIYMEDVRTALLEADLVSLKMDSACFPTWKRINKPVKGLSLEKVKAGMREFAIEYRGKLLSETMLVRGLNDNKENLTVTAEFLQSLQPHKSYLAIPTRPPAIPGTQGPTEESLNMAMQIFSEVLPSVEYLIGYEGNTFSGTGNVRLDLLGILSVHPMTEEAVLLFLEKYQVQRNILDGMLVKREITRTRYKDQTFYVRTIKKQQTHNP